MPVLSLLSIGPKIVAFGANNWKQCLVGLLIGIILYQNTFKFEFLILFGLRTIPGIEQDMAKKDKKILDLKEINLECENSRTTLKDSINDTNIEVKKWFDISQKLTVDQAKIQGQLEEMRRQTAETVDIILAEPTPQTCDAAIQFLKDAVVPVGGP